jgi:hypothetical protein
MRSRILWVSLLTVVVALVIVAYVLGGRPRPVYEGAGAIAALEADDRGLVWLEGDAASEQPGGRVLALTDGDHSPRAIYSELRAQTLSVNGDHVFIVATGGETGELLSVPRGGGQPQAIAEGLQQPGGLWAGEGAVYWTETVSARFPHVSHMPALLGRTTVHRCPLQGGGGAETLAAVEADGGRFHGELLGVHGDRLHWIEFSGATEGHGWSAIRSVPATGGLVETLVREGGAQTALLDGATLYWTAPSEDAGNPLHYASIRRSSVPEFSPVTLTDWLLPGGRLCRLRNRLYYAAIDGLWAVPERLALPRQMTRAMASRRLAAGWRGALYEVVAGPEGKDRLVRRPVTVGARLRAAVGLL